jgi:hypothetical protein
MMMDEIKRQTEDLLAYYPGRGRISLLWLVATPIFWFLGLNIWFGPASNRGFLIQSRHIAENMPYIFGHSFNWIYMLSLVIMLIRICHSERKLLRDTVQIMVSSLLYALVVGLPYVLLVYICILCYVGTSAIAFFQVFAGMICALGSLLLLLLCLGYMAHRFSIVIPFLIFLATVFYTYLLPIDYLARGSLQQHLILTKVSYAVPLFPTDIILREGLFNLGLASGSVWIAAFLHATIGYALAFLIWKKSTERTG